MGWCSATEIMDATLGAADAMISALRCAEEEHQCCPPMSQDELDDALRPFVATIARALRDGDWDCIEESDYFDRFRQEMLGYDDERMATWYREQLAEVDDPTRVAEYSAALVALLERMRA